MTDTLYSEILPRLWIGGTDDHDIIAIPKSLPSLDRTPIFDAVVTLYAYAHPMGWHVHEQRYGFADAALDTKTIERVNELADWLYGRWSRGETVLARCQAGWNRSGLVLALVLVRAGMAPDDAIALLRDERSPHALSNPDFEAYVRRVAPSLSAA
jgi:hypothetical protein